MILKKNYSKLIAIILMTTLIFTYGVTPVTVYAENTILESDVRNSVRSKTSQSKVYELNKINTDSSQLTNNIDTKIGDKDFDNSYIISGADTNQTFVENLYNEDSIQTKDFANKIVTQLGYGDDNDFTKLLHIIDEHNGYSDLNEEDESFLSSIFEIEEKIFATLEEKGYSLRDSIDIALMFSKYKFSFKEVNQLLELYEGFELQQNLGKFNKFTLRENIPHKETKEMKNLFVQGYRIDEIESAYTVSKAFSLRLSDIIRKEKIKDEKALMSNYSGEDIETLNQIYKKYCIDIEKILNYADKKKIKLQDIYSKLNMIELDRNSRSMEQSTIMSSKGSDFDYEKYFNDYHSIKKGSNEIISPASGTLKFEKNLLSLPGRNGLDLNLKVLYDIEQSNLHSPFGYARKELCGSGGKSYGHRSKENTFYERHYGIGAGWSLNLPAIEREHYGTVYKYCKGSLYDFEHYYYEYIHLGDGRKYKLSEHSDGINFTINNYKLKDIKLVRDKTYIDGARKSEYLISYKDGRKAYLDSSGKLMCVKDRYNNTIQYYYNKDGLSRIVDTLDRKINITYTSTSNGKKVTIYCPDNSEIVMNIEKLKDEINESDDSMYIPSYVNNYILKTIKDKENRVTTFNYIPKNSRYCMFNPEFYHVVNRGKNRYMALERVEYLPNTSTRYTYEDLRVKTREDNENGTTFNREEYTYNESGRQTTVKNSINTISKYTFDGNSLLIKKEMLKNGTDKIKQTSYTYDGNCMPDKETTTVYGYAGDSTTSNTSQVLQKDWNYNAYGDLLQYKDEEGGITKYQYENKFHRVKLEEQQIDATRWKRTEYSIDPTTGNINWMKHHHFEDGVDKSIKTKYPSYDRYGNILLKQIQRQDGTNIEEQYEYSPVYKNAYLTKKTIAVRDFNNNTQIVEEKNTYYPNTGFLKTHTHSNNMTTYEYDNLGRKTKEINPDTSFKLIQYDDINSIVTLTLENQHKVRQIYDGLGRLKKKEELKNEATNTWITTEENFYNSLSQLKWTKDASGNKTTYEYDILGRKTKITNPDLTYTKTKYYDVQNKKIAVNEEGHEHISIYDKVGNLIEEKVKPDKTQATEYITSYRYDYLGNKTYIKDPNKNETRFKYDDLGRLTEVTNAKGEKISYEYNNIGKLTKTTMQEYEDSGSLTKEIVTEKEYDELGRTIKSYDPYDKATGTKNKVTKISYDKVGNIEKKIDMEGQELNYTYDSLSRVLTQTAKDKTGNIDSQITYNYDKMYTENIMTVNYGSGDITYEYYPNGKLKKETLPNDINKFTLYEYYDDGNLRFIIDPFGLKTEYIYDKRNRIDLIKVDGKTFDYDYNSDGMIKSLKYPNASIKTEFNYYDTNQLKALKNTIGMKMDEYSYGYDGNGNVTAITENNITTTYQYDQLNRLDIITKPNNQTIDYSFDARGNRKEVKSNTSGGIDHLVNINPSEHKYNPLGQLIEYSTCGNIYQYKYNHRGLRSEKVTPTKIVRYYNDQSKRTIAESDGNGNVTAQNIWGHKPLARKINGQYYYYLYNGHGDVVKVVDESGKIVNSYIYDEWGNILEEVEEIENPLRYSGEYFDEESGRYYLRARYYDPKIGRFISKDSYEGDVTNPLSTNQYIYCMNNPLIYVDPSGNIVATVIGGLSGGIIGGVSAALQGKDVWTGILSGGASGAIAGAAVDITVATGGTGLVLIGAAAVGGGVGAFSGDLIDQVGNRWNWGKGEEMSSIINSLNYNSALISGGIGFTTGAFAGVTGYGFEKAGAHSRTLFRNAATNALLYGDDIAIRNTMNGIHHSAYEVANSLLVADIKFTSMYNSLSSVLDYYAKPLFVNRENNKFDYNYNYDFLYSNYNYYPY